MVGSDNKPFLCSGISSDILKQFGKNVTKTFMEKFTDRRAQSKSYFLKKRSYYSNSLHCIF